MQPEANLTSELLRRISEVVRPSRVLLFGSAARGEMGEESDLDVLVIVPDSVDCGAVERRIYRNLIGFGASADVIVATESDVERHKDNFSLVYYPALREGREIYAA